MAIVTAYQALANYLYGAGVLPNGQSALGFVNAYYPYAQKLSDGVYWTIDETQWHKITVNDNESYFYLRPISAYRTIEDAPKGSCLPTYRLELQIRIVVVAQDLSQFAIEQRLRYALYQAASGEGLPKDYRLRVSTTNTDKVSILPQEGYANPMQDPQNVLNPSLRVVSADVLLTIPAPDDCVEYDICTNLAPVPCPEPPPTPGGGCSPECLELIDANTEAIDALDGRVTVNEGNITTLQGDVINLQNQIDNIDAGGEVLNFIFPSAQDIPVRSLFEPYLGNANTSVTVTATNFIAIQIRRNVTINGVRFRIIDNSSNLDLTYALYSTQFNNSGRLIPEDALFLETIINPVPGIYNTTSSDVVIPKGVYYFAVSGGIRFHTKGRLDPILDNSANLAPLVGITDGVNPLLTSYSDIFNPSLSPAAAQITFGFFEV